MVSLRTRQTPRAVAGFASHELETHQNAVSARIFIHPSSACPLYQIARWFAARGYWLSNTPSGRIEALPHPGPPARNYPRKSTR